jgi:hypothetical protein
MVAFSSEVYKNTAEQPTSDLTDYTDYLKKRAKAAQKWEGSATGYVPQTSLADDLAAQDAYKSGEYNRRTGAAEQEMGLAKAEDTRTASVADRVKQALYDRTQAQQATDTASGQQTRTAYQGAQEAQQGYKQSLQKLDFTKYTNAADRYDSLKAAWDKGTAEFEILKANRAGALNIADLDRYYGMAMAEMMNELEKVKSFEQDSAEAIALKILNMAKGTASVVEGGTELAMQIFGYAMQKK